MIKTNSNIDRNSFYPRFVIKKRPSCEKIHANNVSISNGSSPFNILLSYFPSHFVYSTYELNNEIISLIYFLLYLSLISLSNI